MWQEWYQSARRRQLLAAWRAEGVIGDDGVAHAATRWPLGVAPGQWLDFARQACAWLGVVLLAAATVCFVAANWAAIGKFGRLAGLQILLVAAVAGALAPRLGEAGRAVALVFASLVLGALLALVGQTYQTGADPWQLFALWAALMLPWALAARSATLWLLALGVANLALHLWTADDGARELAGLAAFTALNLGALAVWEYGWRAQAWLRRAAGPRLVVALVLAVLTVRVVLHELGGEAATALPWWAAVMLASGAWYRFGRLDLSALALVLLSGIVVLTVLCAARLVGFGSDSPGVLALLAVLVLAQSALGTAWLRRVAGGGRHA